MERVRIKCPNCSVKNPKFFKLIKYIDFDGKRKKVIKCMSCGNEFFVDVNNKV